ncbi:MAG TPA: hypothetical protein VIK91_25175 [Nannocystis sp.]
MPPTPPNSRPPRSSAPWLTPAVLPALLVLLAAHALVYLLVAR